MKTSYALRSALMCVHVLFTGGDLANRFPRPHSSHKQISMTLLYFDAVSMIDLYMMINSSYSNDVAESSKSAAIKAYLCFSADHYI